MKGKICAATALSLSMLLLSNPVCAQESESGEGDAIVVTGSRIQRQDFVAPSPIVTVGSEAIADSGRATLDDYLRDLPQFTAGTGDFSNDSNGGTAGRATLNLRGLGSQRNLVLMDGRRLMSSGTDGAIDINTIPSLAIGNIEVISGGASATYGSDALSGVINFKVRTDLDGFEVRSQYTMLDQAGEDSWQIGGAWGSDFANGDGKVLLSAEYTDRGGVRVRDRAFFLNPAPSSFIPQGRSRIGPNWITFNDDGTLFNQGTGAGYNGSLALPFLRDPATGAIGYHGSYDNLLQVPLERLSLFGKVEYDLGGSTNFYAQGIYTDSTANNIGAAPNIAGAPWAVLIPATNPFLVAVRARYPGQFGSGAINSFQTRISQAGARIYETNNETYQLLAGLNGQVDDRDLNWDIHASYGKATNEDRTISGAASVSALQRLLDAPDGGNSICAGGYNPFGGANPLSSACLSYISRAPLNVTTLDLWVVEGNLEGAAFTLPAGEARFAITSQFRENQYGFRPDADIARGDLANLSATLPTSGSIRALEVGGELFLPLLKDAPFAQEVNLTLGYRFSDYNLSGSAGTYKAELDAQVTDWLMVRGGYQHALRAPNVGEYFLAGEQRVVGIGVPPSGGDPCDSRAAPTGDRLLLCRAEGVPANYRAATASTPAVTQGNRNLDPEKANSITAGVVLDFPLGASRLRLSGDYYAIRIRDAIAPISAADSLQQCYNVTGSTPGFNAANYLAGNFYCGLFDRTVTGELTIIQQPIRNLGTLKTSGLDFAADLRLPVDALSWGGEDGSIGITSNINYLMSFKQQNFAGSPALDYAGTLSASAQEAFPELRGLTSLNVQTGPVTLIATWRHTSSMDDRSTVINPASTVAGVPSYDYFDMTARVALGEIVEVYGGVQNLADKGPPIVGGAAGSTNGGTFDTIGRTFFVGATARF